MAVFTIEFGELIDDGVDVGLNDYPIFDEAYREHLNATIIDYFRYREIGVVPPKKFVHFFRRRLNLSMPYYNDMYRSQRIEFNPLYTTDIKTVNDEERTGERVGKSKSSDEGASKATSVNEDESRSLFSTAPQQQLQGDEDYASTITDGKGKAQNTTVSDSSNTTYSDSEDVDKTLGKYISHVAGYSGINPGQALDAYRQSLINVDMLVLRDLEICFMQLWAANVNGL